MCLGMPLLNACSFFRSADKGDNGIKNIEVVQDEQGNAIITITYTDSSKKPVTFTLPKGENGQDGAGIKKVEYTQDQYGVTTVTISFTNSLEPVNEIVTVVTPYWSCEYSTFLMPAPSLPSSPLGRVNVTGFFELSV